MTIAAKIEKEITEEYEHYTNKFKNELDRRYEDYKNGDRLISEAEVNKRIVKIIKGKRK